MYPFVKVSVTYLGKPLSKKNYDEHPEIHHLYPTKQAFNILYRSLINEIFDKGFELVLEITENSIKVNGEAITL